LLEAHLDVTNFLSLPDSEAPQSGTDILLSCDDIIVAYLLIPLTRLGCFFSLLATAISPSSASENGPSGILAPSPRACLLVWGRPSGTTQR
jgi:hypothetical protein